MVHLYKTLIHDIYTYFTVTKKCLCKTNTNFYCTNYTCKNRSYKKLQIVTQKLSVISYKILHSVNHISFSHFISLKYNLNIFKYLTNLSFPYVVCSQTLYIHKAFQIHRFYFQAHILNRHSS